MSTGQPRSLPVPRPTHRSVPSTASDISDARSFTTDSGSVTPSSVSSRLPFPEVQPAQRRRQPRYASANIPASTSLPGASASGSNNVSTAASTSTSTALPPCVPAEPLPDSLLCRSTFSALDHSAGTLKRLAKNVLTSTAAVVALLEQLESAEDELLSHLGELGRWLEGGYGVNGDVWDSDGGIRKVAKEKRIREREELEVMVGHSLEAVRGEVKRQGLAGGSAAVKFEGVSKQYYAQTGSYLQGAATDTSDQAHTARAAQFDLARYNYHSTLLYAVPPSSIGCLDLLVGLYSWVGAQIGVPNGKRTETNPAMKDEFARLRRADVSSGFETPTQKGRQLAASETPVRLLLRDDEGARGSVDALSKTLSLSLAHIAQVRVDLLKGWGERDSITTLLEERAKLLGALSPEAVVTPAAPPSPPELGIRYDKPKKKLGGKIRGLFGSNAPPTSASSSSLAERAPPVSSSMMPPPMPSRKSMDAKRGMSIPPVLQEVIPGRGDRQGRNSAHISRHRSGRSHDLSAHLPSRPRAEVLAETAAKLNGARGSEVDGNGDEDEQRELVGRKKEGVLWGTGSWEVLDKNGGKGKWERLYVVLAHSNIYEYREQPGKHETAATVIDLKFASVREGRGTDRRFVFEVVTPSKGRRLYQALSDSEMKTWLYAIRNAIESCINGSSTVRSSDRKLLEELEEVEDRRTPKPPSGKSQGKSHKPTENRHSLPAAPPDGDRRKRRTSLKNRLKQGAGIGSSKRGSVDIERPMLLAQAGRSSTFASSSSQRQSWQEDRGSDRDIEKRVYEMAGLQPSSSRSGVPSPAVSPQPPVLDASGKETQPELPKFDMAMLKKIADTGANKQCADCGRRHKSSRWATLSLREVPMVMFLCIRCVGVHRGLGTHISKPRSVDLDNWTPDAVLLAHKWGNERGNAVWEKLKPKGVAPNDEDIQEYIKAKYVSGVWLSESDKAVYGVESGGSSSNSNSVGQAL